MLTRRTFFTRATGALVTGFVGAHAATLFGQAKKAAGPSMTVYKSPTCGCCGKWVDILKDSGFDLTVNDVDDIEAMKDKLGVPKGVRSCHTGVADNYLIEGHVPAREIQLLLKNKPMVAGLAVAGMPGGVPGMAAPGAPIAGFPVVAFQKDGTYKVFAQY
jgi:hypothetical protein